MPLILLFVIVFIFGLYSQLKSVFGWSFQISGVIDISFLGGTYGMYIFFGALCKRGVFKKIPSAVLWLFIAAGTVLCVWLLTYSIRIGNSIRLWYDFPGVLLASCSIFELFSRMDCTAKSAARLAPLATATSVSSFGTFFVHKVVIFYLGNAADKVFVYDPLKTVVFFIATFIISAAVSYLFYKIPKFNRLIMAAK